MKTTKETGTVKSTATARKPAPASKAGKIPAVRKPEVSRLAEAKAPYAKSDTFKDFIINLRVALDLTQVELARILKVSQNTVCSWERNAVNPDVAKPRTVTLVRLRSFLTEKKMAQWVSNLNRFV